MATLGISITCVCGLRILRNHPYLRCVMTPPAKSLSMRGMLVELSEKSRASLVASKSAHKAVTDHLEGMKCVKDDFSIDVSDGCISLYPEGSLNSLNFDFAAADELVDILSSWGFGKEASNN